MTLAVLYSTAIKEKVLMKKSEKSQAYSDSQIGTRENLSDETKRLIALRNGLFERIHAGKSILSQAGIDELAETMLKRDRGIMEDWSEYVAEGGPFKLWHWYPIGLFS